MVGDHLVYENWSKETEHRLNEALTDDMAVIKWAFKQYNDHILYSCSFGAEGMVLLDLISKINPTAKIVFLDTNLHFKETYTLIDRVKEKYPRLAIQMTKASLTLEDQAQKHGEKLWERNPNLCCHLRKIIPLERELSQVDAWFSGLRREQVGRENTYYVNKDSRFKKIKICPLIHWTWEDIWNYIKLNDLPYNALHDKDYPSIGCEMCTLPVKMGADQRSGRWANFKKRECGLHQPGK
jgi:phosphoadenosine phosphosulfate reductase